jgi:hypothetical protein
MKMSQRNRWLVVGVVVSGLIAILAFDKVWTGDRTVYFDNCQKRVALQKRLSEAGVAFSLVERGGIALGRVNEKELALRLGLTSLLDVPPDTTTVCK